MKTFIKLLFVATVLACCSGCGWKWQPPLSWQLYQPPVEHFETSETLIEYRLQKVDGDVKLKPVPFDMTEK